ncbi:MAG: polyprenyl synthetase family protein [Cellvibrionales bacterium]|nr:polyprenyl synthetase family protein [Cellvibrionales bacterium]
MTAPEPARWRTAVVAQVHAKLAQLLDEIAPESPARLSDAMRYALLGGGKRVRAMLCFASARLVDEAALECPAVLAAACAVEMLHGYSLIHDDLPAMDDAALRRGRPAVHIAFDQATAILAGDALQALAFATLCDSPGAEDGVRLGMVARLADASGALGMVGGQMLDLEAADKGADLAALTRLHRLKTGALMRAASVLGGRAGGGDAATLARLDDYADQLGLAFQIQDDILDQTAATATLGKPQGADAARGLPTYVSLLGLAGARDRLRDCHARSLAALQPFDAVAAAPLVELADYVIERGY